jgi:hypothetical protein
MLSSNQLMHYEAGCPQVDCFPVWNFTKHLFWSLIH